MKLSELGLEIGDKVKLLKAYDLERFGWPYGVEATVDQCGVYGIDRYYWGEVDGEWEVNGVPVATSDPNHLQYFTMNALVEAVSKAIDAGDTQSARAIIDAMEAK